MNWPDNLPRSRGMFATGKTKQPDLESEITTMRLVFTIQEHPNHRGRIQIDVKTIGNSTPMELAMANKIADAAQLAVEGKKVTPPAIDITQEPTIEDPADPGCEIIPLPESRIIIP